MQVFEKIKEAIQKEIEDVIVKDTYTKGKNAGLRKAEKLVDEVTEEYNNGWIPCSERLPEENLNVIACFAHGLVTELTFHNGLFHGIYDYNTNVIIAWQPLPAPYQPKGE